MRKKISIIIPCYYNELNIPVTSVTLLENEKIFPENVDFEYVMVDDGSKDNTLGELKKFQNQYPEKVKIIKLAGNFGSYNAILAGMLHATGDCNVVISCDLQDPPELILKMYEHWSKGLKLVLANRQERNDSFVSDIFSKLYHKLLKRFTSLNIPDGGFDFCLFDRQLKDKILAMDEKNTNTLYLLLLLNYEYVCIPYTRQERKIGKSRWTLKKRIKLFIDSFVSFSFFPLRAITVSGIVLGLLALIYAFVVIYNKIAGNIKVEGWSMMMMVFLLVSSFQMTAIGIIGEYLWRTLDAARKRPSYVIEKVFDKDEVL